MEGFPLAIEIVVRFSDCDPIGHVNNATYFSYLEEARFAWFRAALGENSFEKHPIILGEATCTFRAAAAPGDTLLVGIRVERIGRASFDHKYRLERKSDGKLIAEAKTTAVGYDYATNASRELGAEFRAAVERHQGKIPG
ncbi:MAG TPA: thioesterase family protein [bacterium]|nr:thioesterase family protein [bacterium]